MFGKAGRAETATDPAPLSMVADIKLTRGAPVIKSENARPNAWVYVDISTSDIGGFVQRAKKLVNSRLKLPPGYTLTWSGQFEFMERAQKRLEIVVPFTLLLIFLLLYFNFRNLAEPVIVMLSIPFALVGGIWLIYFSGYNLSVAIAVGFIALAGVAAEIGVLGDDLYRPGAPAPAGDRVGRETHGPPDHGSGAQGHLGAGPAHCHDRHRDHCRSFADPVRQRHRFPGHETEPPPWSAAWSPRPFSACWWCR